MDKDRVESYTEILERVEREVKGIETYKPNYQDNDKKIDHPDTMEDGAALLLYIIVMIVGAIFNDKLIIWAFASFIYFKFVTRHNKK